MTAIEFSVDLQGAQMGAMLMGVGPLLADEMGQAMADIVTMLSTDTVSFMDWQNPSGALEDSIPQDSSSTTWSAAIGSSLPYTRRRDWGFDGADSLGRVYHDLGAYFLDDALEEDTPDIEARIFLAIQRTFFGIAASI